MGANASVLLEFGGVTTSAVPEVDVGASGVKQGHPEASNRLNTLSKDEQVIIDFVTMIERDMTIGRFWSPNLGWNVNHEGSMKRS